MVANQEKTVEEHELLEDDERDVEKAFLDHELAEHTAYPQKTAPPGLSRKFWVFAAINTLSTAGIVRLMLAHSHTRIPKYTANNCQVFVNKRLFEHERLRHSQVTIAAFHFAVTALTLYAVSRPRINVFQPKRVPVLRILPLAISMICNVVLLNLSLAYSSIQFYQIVRVLVTPAVALLNYIIVKATIPVNAALTLIPVCAGVAIVSYFGTAPKSGSTEKATEPIGVVFAFAALFASAIYTVWIDKYHRVLECTSMQLLLNQAPMSVLVMLFVIPFSDDITVWVSLDSFTWILVLLVSLCHIPVIIISLTTFVERHPSLSHQPLAIPDHQRSRPSEQHRRRPLQDMPHHRCRLVSQRESAQRRQLGWNFHGPGRDHRVSQPHLLSCDSNEKSPDRMPD
jgi:solute carrier family 35 protein E3